MPPLPSTNSLMRVLHVRCSTVTGRTSAGLLDVRQGGGGRRTCCEQRPSLGDPRSAQRCRHLPQLGNDGSECNSGHYNSRISEVREIEARPSQLHKDSDALNTPRRRHLAGGAR
jgi:hypothetical protein